MGGLVCGVFLLCDWFLLFCVIDSFSFVYYIRHLNLIWCHLTLIWCHFTFTENTAERDLDRTSRDERQKIGTGRKNCVQQHWIHNKAHLLNSSIYRLRTPPWSIILHRLDTILKNDSEFFWIREILSLFHLISFHLQQLFSILQHLFSSQQLFSILQQLFPSLQDECLRTEALLRGLKLPPLPPDMGALRCWRRDVRSVDGYSTRWMQGLASTTSSSASSRLYGAGTSLNPTNYGGIGLPLPSIPKTASETAAKLR